MVKGKGYASILSHKRGGVVRGFPRHVPGAHFLEDAQEGASVLQEGLSHPKTLKEGSVGGAVKMMPI